MRFHWLVLLCWAQAFAQAASGAAAAEQRLNVVLICADDLNVDLGCYGHPLVKSPNIDRLASRGVRFERAYCQYPVCNASRTSFLSGRRPKTTGVIDNVTPPRTHLGDAVFLPQHFRQNGYKTLKVGKIFHTGDEFEDPRSWDIDIREDRTAKNPPDEQIVARRGEHGIVLECDDLATWDGLVASRGVAMLDEAASGGAPFFLAIGFRRPHAPYIAPRRFHEFYPESLVPPLREPAEHLSAIPPIALTYRRGAERMNDSDRPDVVGAYWASISFMDAQLGRVLDAIDRRRLWKNTVVVFMSDHGYHLGEHGGLWHKMTLFEAAARVPFVIAAPGKAARRESGVVELVDLFPTLCGLCELEPPVGLEGRDLFPALDGKPMDARPAFTVVSHGRLDAAGALDPAKMGYSVRTDRWRFTHWFDGSQELYDYQGDPHEYRNLAGQTELAPIVAEHRKLLVEVEPR